MLRYMQHTILLVMGLIVLGPVDTTSSAENGQPIVKVLADFEGANALDVWDVTQPGADWAGTSELRGEISDEWSARGRQSLKVTFDKYEKGEGEWRVTLLNLAKLGLGDFRGWDTVELDGYVVTPEASIRVGLWGEKRKLFKTGYSTGHWRVAIRLDQLRMPDADLTNTDLSKIKGIELSMRQPLKRVIGYLDDIRLVDYKPMRLAALSKRIRDAMNWARRVSDGPMRSQVVGALELLEIQIKATLEALRCLAVGAAREPIRSEVARLEAETAVRLRAVASQLSEPLVQMLTALGPDRPFDVPERSRVSKTATLARDAVDLDSLEAAMQSLSAQARHRQQIREHYPNAAFAVGVPLWPRSMPDQPQSYDGPIGNNVRLYAARHEYEPFQLVLFPKGRDMKNVRLRATALTQTGGPGSIESEHIEIAPMGWRQRAEDARFWAEMLRPDVTRFDIAANAQQPVWLNVYVPPDTPAGDYEGLITIEADDVPPQTIEMDLTVWPFTLPHYATMVTAVDGWGDGEQDPEKLAENARRMIAHRFNPNAIYTWHERQFPGAETWQRWYEWGGRFFNLLRISRNVNFVRDQEGRLHVRDMNVFFNRLDNRISAVREAGLLEQCMLYGFDELPTEMVPTAYETFGLLKDRYGPIKTLIAVNLPIWEQYPAVENIDMIAFIPRILTPEIMKLYHDQGVKLLWYNIYHNQQDAVRNRVQFWGTFKDGFDGVLHYKLSAGAGPTYGPGLYPPRDRKPGYGGILRGGSQGVISTLAFEFFREGLEDCEYLHLLKEARQRLAELPTDRLAQHRSLFREADYLVRVPDYVTTGLVGGRTKMASEIAVNLIGNTKDMNVILATRYQIAQLIVAINKILTDLPP